MNKIVIIASTSGHNGEGFQLLNELKFIREYSPEKIYVYINSNLTREYLDKEIEKYASLCRFQVFKPTNNVFWRKIAQVKFIGLFILRLRFYLLLPKGDYKFVIFGLVNLKGLLLLTKGREIIFWHNTHKAQYCDKKDEKYLSEIFKLDSRFKERLKILVIDNLQKEEVIEELGRDVFISKFNLKW